MVVGSMTMIKSQSMRGVSLKAWRLVLLAMKFATAPPRMVMFDSATDCVAVKPAQKSAAQQRTAGYSCCSKLRVGGGFMRREKRATGPTAQLQHCFMVSCCERAWPVDMIPTRQLLANILLAVVKA